MKYVLDSNIALKWVLAGALPLLFFGQSLVTLDS
jgi:hypothetical protein